ncbi:MAG: hypothetical protein Q9201_004318 [Fulgogasparrea decipioides]
MKTLVQQIKNPPSKPDKTDERLERIRENILPDVPYLMDCHAPYQQRLPSDLANNWRRSCPFGKHEEQLQYMTFLSHTFRGDTMLRTRGDWDDGDGRLKNESAKRTSGSSSGGISPLPGQPPRKKISLLDYKNKMAGQASGRSSPKAGSMEKQPSNVSAKDAETSAKPTTEVAAPSKPNTTKDEAPQRSEHKVPHGQKRYEGDLDFPLMSRSGM